MEHADSHREDDLELEQWVIGTRRAQGLPDHVEDPVILARIVELLFSSDGETGADSA
jgi:hypothetical protein